MIDDRGSHQRRHCSKRKKKMNARYGNNKPFGESRAVRNEDIWHSVWKRIEDSPCAETPPNKGKMSLEPPRDYVVDSDNQHSDRSA